MKKYKSYDLGKIYKSPQTVFTTKDIVLLWGVTQLKLVWARINDYTKTKKLYRIKRGIYSKDKNYNKLELATKIYTPAYVSLETVLAKEGIIFQYYETIFVVSYLTRKVETDKQKIQIRKIKNEILLNSSGIIQKENYSIATKERAFLDALYLYKNYYFDNLDVLDKKKVFELAKIYQNKQLIKKVKTYFNA
ncbi:hypothetical protein KKG58_04580 [Patescibacteria group bacterium]|nr:hypothetical protein [Patescibacteria group bacterium]